MNKVDLAQDIAGRLGIERKQAAAALDAVLEALGENVAKGEKISLAGFGIFERVDRDARTARNPATGETVDVAATKVIKFKPASALKATVAGS